MNRGGLAILGDHRELDHPLHAGRPNNGNREWLLERIEGARDRRWLRKEGPLTQDFEQRLADYLGFRHCIVMANGTIGLEILIRAAGLEGEVVGEDGRSMGCMDAGDLAIDEIFPPVTT